MIRISRDSAAKKRRKAKRIEAKDTELRPTTMGNMAILVALAATITVSESACTDSSKWSAKIKGKKRKCAWVAKKPDSRCGTVGTEGKGKKAVTLEANAACQE